MVKCREILDCMSKYHGITYIHCTCTFFNSEREWERRHKEILSQTNQLTIGNNEKVPATVDDLEHLGDLGHGKSHNFLLLHVM